jgi:hypothetical protein
VLTASDVLIAANNSCICNAGFSQDGHICVPVCEGGCVNGNCTAPNTCTCNAGYIQHLDGRYQSHPHKPTTAARILPGLQPTVCTSGDDITYAGFLQKTQTHSAFYTDQSVTHMAKTLTWFFQFAQHKNRTTQNDNQLSETCSINLK